MADRDIVGEIAAELKLSRRKVLAVLDLWDAKCAEPTPEREAFVNSAKMAALMELRGSMLGGRFTLGEILTETTNG